MKLKFDEQLTNDVFSFLIKTDDKNLFEILIGLEFYNFLQDFLYKKEKDSNYTDNKIQTTINNFLLKEGEHPF